MFTGENSVMVSAEIHVLLLIVPCFLLFLSIMFNAIGIYYLRSVRTDFTNQRILLLNLSSVEILSCIAMMLFWFDGYFKFCNFGNASTLNSISAICTFGFVSDWYFYLLCLFSPLTLLLDRFLGVTFPIEYIDIFSKQKAKLTVMAQWTITVILVTQLAFMRHVNWLRYLQYTAIAIQLLVFSSATIIYVWIAYKVRRQAHLFSRANADSRVLKVASLIILTYLCFVVMPELTILIMTQLQDRTGITYQRIFYTFTTVNYVCDPLIYIFGYPPLRRAIRRLTRRPKRALSFSTAQELRPNLQQS